MHVWLSEGETHTHTEEEEKEKEEDRRRDAFSFLFEAGDSVMANFSLQNECQGFVTKDQQQSATIRHSHSTVICAICLLRPPSGLHGNASLRN